MRSRLFFRPLLCAFSMFIGAVSFSCPSEDLAAAEEKNVGGQTANVRNGRDPKSRDVVPQTAEVVDDRELRSREAARLRGEISFDDLKFGIEKDQPFLDEMLDEKIRQFEKKTVRIRGYILPTSVFHQKGFDRFVLVRDNQECCFGPGAAIYDCVMVEMQPGKTADFATRVVSVKGVFAVDTESYRYPDGGHYAIYKIIASEVK